MLSKLTNRIRQLFFFVLGLILLFFIFNYVGKTLQPTPAQTKNENDSDQMKKTYSNLLLNQQIKQDEELNKSPIDSNTEGRTDPAQ